MKGETVRRKLIVLGDTYCGKTWLEPCTNSANLLQSNKLDIFNNFIRFVDVEGVKVELVTWDNTGMDGYEKLRRLSYEDAHVVLVCFDINTPDSFDNVSTFWSKEVDTYFKNVPKILVGCKADLRENPASIKQLQLIGQVMPTIPECEDLALKMKALAYFETSVKNRTGLNEVFEYAAKAALVKSGPKAKKGIRRFLSRSDIKFVR
ncbi:GTP-binding protein rho3 precursor [Lindgomyces ingoldianus]|uniref:GTP-binding protein rho3 n=1 Tax=Lindgomyces ingoldianus TaxID=673940 RepID=A0ACB6QNC6_9PLEO|nr:GTP-binding protein rho3 precursor [Lindgomyces ingoldianus]KAF2468514.1 GTP-binding protein rho3 precursor [Lindgomyces ingoldianus]